MMTIMNPTCPDRGGLGTCACGGLSSKMPGAFTKIMHPGGECRSACFGASHDLNSGLRLVAQMSSPSTCSKSFLLSW